MTYVNPYSRPPQGASPAVRRVFETTDYGIVNQATAIIGRERYKQEIKLHGLGSYFKDGSKLAHVFRHRDSLTARHDKAQEALHQRGLDINQYKHLTHALVEDTTLLEQITREEQRFHEQYEHAQRALARSEERYIKSKFVSEYGEDAYIDFKHIDGKIEELRSRIGKKKNGMYAKIVHTLASIFGISQKRSENYLSLTELKTYRADLKKDEARYKAEFARTREAYLAQHGLGQYLEQCADFNQKRRALEEDLAKTKKELAEYQRSVGLVTTELNTRAGIIHANATLDDPKHRSAARGEEPLWHDYRESLAAHAQLVDLECRLGNHLDGITRTTPN